MGDGPVIKALAPGGLDTGIFGSSRNRHENRRLTHRAGRGVCDTRPYPEKINKQRARCTACNASYVSICLRSTPKQWLGPDFLALSVHQGLQPTLVRQGQPDVDVAVLEVDNEPVAVMGLLVEGVERERDGLALD